MIYCCRKSNAIEWKYVFLFTKYRSIKHSKCQFCIQRRSLDACTSFVDFISNFSNMEWAVDQSFQDFLNSIQVCMTLCTLLGKCFYFNFLCECFKRWIFAFQYPKYFTAHYHYPNFRFSLLKIGVKLEKRKRKADVIDAHESVFQNPKWLWPCYFLCHPFGIFIPGKYFCQISKFLRQPPYLFLVFQC